MQQTISLSNFDNRHSLITSEDDFSDDSLENANVSASTSASANANSNAKPSKRNTTTQIIEIKVENKNVEGEGEGEEEDEEEEGGSELLPPSPEPPQMLALTLPLKCSPGIAWEIKMDDNIATDLHIKV